MRERTQFFITLAVIVFLLSCCIILYFCYQDLYRTGKIVSTDEREFNAVIGRHFKFDSVIIGTSMSENFKCSEFDKITGGYSQKMTVSGGHISEIAFIARYALKHQKIKTVLSDIMVRSFILDDSCFKLPLGSYEDSISLPNRICDALSLGTIFRNLKNLSKNKDFDRDKNYSWAGLAPCGMKYFSKYMIEKKDVWKSFVLDLKKYNANDVQNRIDKYLVSLIREHPEVTFYIYLPPYSAMEFAFSTKTYVDFRKSVMDALLQFNNVKLYDFQSEENIIFDFNNYKDTYHYSAKISSYIVAQFSGDKYLVTADNRMEFEKKFNQVINKFDQKKAFFELRKYYENRGK